MMARFFIIAIFVFGAVSGAAQAQSANGAVWVQIEAQPSVAEAVERASDYATFLPDINGFALAGGWYAIALGPYSQADAENVLGTYRAQGLIPRDSYIAFSRSYGTQIFPENTPLGIAAPLEIPLLRGETAQAEIEVPAQAPVADDTETPAQARRGESLLTRDERRALQSALKWAGFYNSAIDGAFGRGTRNAMADWQFANGFEPTGVLTTGQRAALLSQFNAILDGLDMQVVTDDRAGIEIALPLGVTAFDRHEAPFAVYEPRGDSPAQVLLISQNGDRNTLRGLYEVMQTLEIVPLDGRREISRNGFALVGQNGEIISETRVSLQNGEIKGFTLIWPVGDERRRARVLSEMETSLQRLPGTLDPATGDADAQAVDLVAGLEVRQPVLSRSGFYVDRNGAVVTTADAVQSCTRITLDDEYNATLSTLDLARGIAILRPETDLAPSSVARFSTELPRLQSEVAVAGYSFGGQLNAPSMTFGRLSDVKGLQGEADLNRLDMEALPGDAGGPVFDERGQVMGMLLPRPQTGRQLPEDVRFALTSDVIAGLMAEAGFLPSKGQETASLAPEDITERGIGMTVLVSCWE